MNLSVKMKLSLDGSQKQNLDNTLAHAKKIFDLFTGLSCQHHSCSYPTLHKYGYQEAKSLCSSMPTAYIQAVAKQACASVKSFNTNHPRKKWHYRGKRTSISLPLNKLSYSRRGRLSTISTTDKRIRVLHDIPEWFVQRYNINTNQVQSGSIKSSNGEYWLHLQYDVECGENSGADIIGIDRGLYNLIATSDGQIVSAKAAISVKRKYQHNRMGLQQKGTRSANRKLKRLSGREMRFMRDVNHQVAKSLITPNVNTYVLENLKGIRTQRKGKKLNSWLSNWSFFQLQSLIGYKCELSGIGVQYVDPKHTSQTCNACGKIVKSNRHKGRYACECGYTEHADINAAKNIRDKYVLSLQKEQGAFNHPIVAERSSYNLCPLWA